MRMQRGIWSQSHWEYYGIGFGRILLVTRVIKSLC
jgi:hypothetical protein